MFSNFIREFKEFAVKGNVVDLAVGIIIGGAFGKIPKAGDFVRPKTMAPSGRAKKAIALPMPVARPAPSVSSSGMRILCSILICGLSLTSQI